MKRFQDQNYTLATFQDNVLVVCPKCANCAVVYKHNSEDRPARYGLKCSHCMFTLSDRKAAYILDVHAPCVHCEAPIRCTMEHVNEAKSTLAVKCTVCQKRAIYAVKATPVNFIYSTHDQPCEPYFQLPLWLNESVMGHALWAYNREHLAYIKAYIEADIREKNGREFFTLVEKLPVWMQAAKHRAAVLKGIDRLEKKLG